MWKILKNLYSLVEPADRSKVTIISFLIIVTAFVQTAGIASVMPFLAVLSDPSMVQSNALLLYFYERLGFESVDTYLYFLGIAAFVVFTTGTALQALTHWVITRFSFMQQYHLSRRLMADYLRRPYAFFLTRNSGDLSKSVLHETSQAITGALMPAMRLTSYVLLAFTITVLLIVIQPVLAISVAVALGGIYGVIYFFSRRWLDRVGKDRVVANRQRFTASAEAFAGAKEIRLLGREADYLARYEEPSRRFSKHQANQQLLASLPLYAIEAVAFGGILLVILFLMAGEGGIGYALPLIGLYGLAGKQLIPAFQSIFSSVAGIRFNMATVNSVLDDLGDREGSRSLPDASVVIQPLIPEKEIVISGLTFRYAGADAPALNNLNLTIPARSTLGFVGASGAGKSTLIDVMLGLLDPESGEIRIDQTPLGSDNIPRWQATIGYVPQHIFLADQSVAANIALGIPENQIDLDAVEKAARLANLHEFVLNDLAEGYRTVVGERGVRLSGGQRQRIGIARALYRDPSVLVFDEATSALDNTTEQVVMEAIHNLAGQKTIFLVAHRLSTVKSCDCIYVLSGGELVEEGAWDELMQNGGHFSALAASAA